MSFLYPVLLILLFVAAYMAYRRTMPPLSRKLRAFLTVLRTAVFAFIVVLLVDPHCVRHGQSRDEALIAALIDKSASMSLPSGWNDGDTRFGTALRLVSDLDSAVAARGGKNMRLYFSDDLSFSPGDSVSPDGQGTNIVRSLRTLSSKLEGENLGAIVLFSDGVETGKNLVRSGLPPIPVFAVGLGDTNSPQDVCIKDVDYNPIARAPSKTPIKMVLSNSGSESKEVIINLFEDGSRIFRKNVRIESKESDFEQRIELSVPKPGRRNLLLEINVNGFDAEKANNRREIAIDAERTEVKILIVDMFPNWELHFLSNYLKREKTVSFDLISELGAHYGARTLIMPEEFSARINDYDTVILMSITEDFFTQTNGEALKKYVEAGHGLLVLPGSGSLFERRDAWSRLQTILPLRGTPPFPFVLSYTLLTLGEQASLNPITADLVPIVTKTDWQERSPLLGFHSAVVPKPGAQVLLKTLSRGIPALVYGSAGNGRVAAVGAGPLWRWKFLPERPEVYNQVMSRLVEVLAGGEVSERFSLSSRKNVFNAGEPVVLYAEVLDKQMHPITGIPVKVEISKLEEDGREIPIRNAVMNREGAQSSRFKSSLAALGPGVYRFRGETSLEGRVLKSNPLELKVSSVSMEFQNEVQDKNELLNIAHSTGGSYANAANFENILDMVPIRTRVRQTVADIALRTSFLAFAAILLLLSVEWIVRKRVGMI